jgi:hypothetical protein
MSALEQEILEKIRLLDKDAKQRIRQQLEQEEADDSTFTFTTVEPVSPEEWLAWSRDFRARLHAKYGDREVPSSTDLVNEVREES